jgi:hypothetical protein
MEQKNSFLHFVQIVRLQPVVVFTDFLFGSACIECDKFDCNRLSSVEVVMQYKSERFY